jgi:Fic family protein
MFQPNFKYTNKIVNLLSKISAAREVILNSPLIPKWEVTLRREAIIRSAHSSTHIEGNRLNLEQVNKLAHGREITATRKDKQEVLNYLEVLRNINKLIKSRTISVKEILKMHKKVTKDTLERPEDCGAFRTRYVVVWNPVTKEVFFKPPQNTLFWKLVLATMNSYEFTRLSMEMAGLQECWQPGFYIIEDLIPNSFLHSMIIMIQTDQHTTKLCRVLIR